MATHRAKVRPPQKKQKLAAQLAWRTTLLFAGAMLLVVVAAFFLQFRAIKSDERQRARSLVHATEAVFEGIQGQKSLGAIYARLSWIAQNRAVASVDILDGSGRVQISTASDQIGRLFPRHEGTYWSWPRMTAVESLDIKTPVRKTDGQMFVASAAVVVLDLRSSYFAWARIYALIALASVIMALLAGIQVYVRADARISRRIKKLSHVASLAEHGSFLARARWDRPDEIGELALALNRVLAKATHVQAQAMEQEHEAVVRDEEDAMREELVRVLDELKQTNDILERRIKAQELLMEAAHHLGGILNKDALVTRLVSLVRDKLGWPDFAVFLTAQTGGKEEGLKLAIASGLPDIDVIHDMSFRYGEGITGLVAQTKAPIIVNNLAHDNRVKVWRQIQDKDKAPAFLRHGSLLSVPMLYQDRVVGVMDFFCPRLNAFDDDDVTLLSALGALVAMAIVNADLYEATLELATSDPLTGILNRRAMERLIDSEIARSKRFVTPMSLLLIDVDHFKDYNDRMGHVLGDQALKAIARVLQRNVRRVDAVARFGGEEFCVILPQTNRASAVDVAQKLTELIRRIDIKGANKQPLGYLSVSMGVACFPDDAQDVGEADEALEMVNRADEALYAAKHKGRDQVVQFVDLKGE